MGPMSDEPAVKQYDEIVAEDDAAKMRAAWLRMYPDLTDDELGTLVPGEMPAQQRLVDADWAATREHLMAGFVAERDLRVRIEVAVHRAGYMVDSMEDGTDALRLVPLAPKTSW